MKSSTNTRKIPEKTRPAPIAAPAPWKPVWWHWLAAIALVMLIAFEVYGPALHGEFLFDDSYLPFLNVPADAPWAVWLGIRPLLMLSYWVNFKISGLNPYPYHAVNVVFHACNAILAGLIARRALGWIAESGWRREALSIFAGALFLLHPVQTESVAYVASRSEAMSVFFFLSAFAVFAYRCQEGISWTRMLVVLALYGAACTVKEHTTVLPALLLLADYYFITPFRFTAIRNNAKLYGLIGAGALAGLAAVASVLSRANSAGFQLKEFTW